MLQISVEDLGASTFRGQLEQAYEVLKRCINKGQMVEAVTFTTEGVAVVLPARHTIYWKDEHDLHVNQMNQIESDWFDIVSGLAPNRTIGPKESPRWSDEYKQYLAEVLKESPEPDISNSGAWRAFREGMNIDEIHQAMHDYAVRFMRLMQLSLAEGSAFQGVAGVVMSQCETVRLSDEMRYGVFVQLRRSWRHGETAWEWFHEYPPNREIIEKINKKQTNTRVT